MGASRILRVQSGSVSNKWSKIEKCWHHIRTIYGGEWYFTACFIINVPIRKLLHSYVSTKTVYRTYQTFINTGDVKPCDLGRPNDTNTFFPHEEYIIINFALIMPQMQLNMFLRWLVHALMVALNRSTIEFALYYFVQTIYKSEGWYIRLKWPWILSKASFLCSFRIPFCQLV